MTYNISLYFTGVCYICGCVLEGDCDHHWFYECLRCGNCDYVCDDCKEKLSSVVYHNHECKVCLRNEKLNVILL